MYLRVKMQQRALDNLAFVKEKQFSGMRVTKGFIISKLLCEYGGYINSKRIDPAIELSDMKQEGGGVPVTLSITADANKSLALFKTFLDVRTQRSFFPAQILDILLICVRDVYDKSFEVDHKELAKMLMDAAYTLLTEEALPEKTKQDLIKNLQMR